MVTFAGISLQIREFWSLSLTMLFMGHSLTIYTLLYIRMHAHASASYPEQHSVSLFTLLVGLVPRMRFYCASSTLSCLAPTATWSRSLHKHRTQPAHDLKPQHARQANARHEIRSCTQLFNKAACYHYVGLALQLSWNAVPVELEQCSR